MCNVILGESIVGVPITDVINFNEEDDLTNSEILNTVISKLNTPVHNYYKVEAYLNLLPDILSINEKTVMVEYKIIEDMEVDKLMLILTDITERVLLEEQVRLEEEMLKMLVEIFTNANDFNHILKEYRQFYSEEIPDFNNLTTELKVNAIEQIYRVVHPISRSPLH